MEETRTPTPGEIPEEVSGKEKPKAEMLALVWTIEQGEPDSIELIGDINTPEELADFALEALSKLSEKNLYLDRSERRLYEAGIEEPLVDLDSPRLFYEIYPGLYFILVSEDQLEDEEKLMRYLQLEAKLNAVEMETRTQADNSQEIREMREMREMRADLRKINSRIDSLQSKVNSAIEYYMSKEEKES
jgi:hypothetical protein